ncbi:Dihydropterin deaminase [Carabus blaptoides fortunei]
MDKKPPHNVKQRVTMDTDAVMIVVGNIVHCTSPFTVHTIEKGFVIVRDCKIVAIDNVSKLWTTREQLGIAHGSKNVKLVTLSSTQLLIPGLVDTHIHAPQYPNAGLGYDMQLLDWLKNYTFPLEERYKDVHFAKKVYEAVVARTLAHGTTTACYFATIHLDSSLALCEAAIQAGQRAFVGKVNMNVLCPAELTETNEESIAHTEQFIQAVLAKNCDLVQPVITPRFALSCDMELLSKLGDIAKKYNLNIQSHISENLDEIHTVQQMFHKKYAQVYDDAKLLTRKTVLAHGVHLEPEEMHLLATRGTSIAHCPASNSCLQSGLCDVRALIHAGVNIGLGTDISGGPSPSIVEAMRCALTTSIHNSYSDKTHLPLNCYDVFYLATLGGAKALAIDDRIGNFAVGKQFDALVIDMNVKNGGTDFLHDCTPLELLQKFIYTGDDRNVSKVYVAGLQVK